MKKVFIIPLVIFSFLSSTSFADKDWMWVGFGAVPCSKLVRNLNERGILENYANASLASWIQGYVTGINVSNDRLLKIRPDWDGVVLEVIKRCKKEPMNDIIVEIDWIYRNKIM